MGAATTGHSPFWSAAARWQVIHERARASRRPRSLSAKGIAAAQALLRDPAISVTEVAKRLKVAPATLYRALPGGRAALEE